MLLYIINKISRKQFHFFSFQPLFWKIKTKHFTKCIGNNLWKLYSYNCTVTNPFLQTLCLNVRAAEEEVSLRAPYAGLMFVVMFTRALPPLPSVHSASLFVSKFITWAYFSLYTSIIKTRHDGLFLCWWCFACMLLLMIQVDLNELLCSVLFIGVKWVYWYTAVIYCVLIVTFFCFHYQNWLLQQSHTHTLLPWPGSCHLKLGSSRSCPTHRPPHCCTRWWDSTSCPCASLARNRWHVVSPVVEFRNIAFMHVKGLYLQWLINLSCLSLAFRCHTCSMWHILFVSWCRKRDPWIFWRYTNY